MRHEQDRRGRVGPGKSQEPSAVEEQGAGRIAMCGWTSCQRVQLSR